MKGLVTQGSFSLKELDSFSNLPDQKGTESESRIERNASSCPEENIQKLLQTFDGMKKQEDEVWSQNHNNSQLNQFFQNGGRMDISNNMSHLQESNLQEFSYDDDEEQNNIKIGGIPLQNIYENSEWIKPFQCFLCNNVAVQPIRCTSCSGLFCKGCILDWESRNEIRRICPKCQTQQSFNISTQESELKPDYNTQKFLQDINVDCVYKNNGCSEIITYAEYEDHVKNCPKRMKICLNCGENFIYDQAELHKNFCSLQSIQMDNNKSISEYSIRPSQLGFQSDLKTFSDLPSIASQTNFNQLGTVKKVLKRNSEKIHVRNFKQNQNKGRHESPHSLSHINQNLQEIQENSMNQIEELCTQENLKLRQKQSSLLENSKIEEESHSNEINRQMETLNSFQKAKISERLIPSSNIFHEQNNNSYVNVNNQSIEKQANQLNSISLQPQQVISISQNNSHLIFGIAFLILILLSVLLFNQYNDNQQTKLEFNDNTISKIYKESYQFHNELQEYLNQIREKYSNFQSQQQTEITSVKMNMENYINTIKQLQQNQEEYVKSQIISKVQEENSKLTVAVNGLKENYQNSLNSLSIKQDFLLNEFTKFQSASCKIDEKQLEENNQMIITKIKNDFDQILDKQIRIQLEENNNALTLVLKDLINLDLFVKKQEQEFQQIQKMQQQLSEKQTQQISIQQISDIKYQQFYETLKNNITSIYQNLDQQIKDTGELFSKQIQILTQDIKNFGQSWEQKQKSLQNDNQEVKNSTKAYNQELKQQMEEVLVQIKHFKEQNLELKNNQQQNNKHISDQFESLKNNFNSLNKDAQEQKQINSNLNSKLSQWIQDIFKRFDSFYEQITQQIQKDMINTQKNNQSDKEIIKLELNFLRSQLETIAAQSQVQRNSSPQQQQQQQQSNRDNSNDLLIFEQISNLQKKFDKFSEQISQKIQEINNGKGDKSSDQENLKTELNLLRQQLEKMANQSQIQINSLSKQIQQQQQQESKSQGTVNLQLQEQIIDLAKKFDKFTEQFTQQILKEIQNTQKDKIKENELFKSELNTFKQQLESIAAQSQIKINSQQKQLDSINKMDIRLSEQIQDLFQRFDNFSQHITQQIQFEIGHTQKDNKSNQDSIKSELNVLREQLQVITSQIKGTSEQQQQLQQSNDQKNFGQLSEQILDLFQRFDKFSGQITQQIQKEISNTQKDNKTDLESIKSELKFLKQLLDRIDGKSQIQINTQQQEQQQPNNQNSNVIQSNLQSQEIKQYLEKQILKLSQELDLIKQNNSNQNQMTIKAIQDLQSKQSDQEMPAIINQLIQQVKNLEQEIRNTKVNQNQNQYQKIENEVAQLKQELLKKVENIFMTQNQQIKQLTDSNNQNQQVKENQMNQLLNDFSQMNNSLNKILESLKTSQEIKTEIQDIRKFNLEIFQEFQTLIQQNNKNTHQVKEFKQQILKQLSAFSQENQYLKINFHELKELLLDLPKQQLNLNQKPNIIIEESRSIQYQQIEKIVLPFIKQQEDIQVQKLNEFQKQEDFVNQLCCNIPIKQISFEKESKFSYCRQLNSKSIIEEITAYYDLNKLISIVFKFANKDYKDLTCGQDIQNIYKKQTIVLKNALKKIQIEEEQFVMIFSKDLSTQ